MKGLCPTAKLFAHVDQDRSGTITEEEFKTWFMDGADGLHSTLKSVFAVGDRVKIIKVGSQTGRECIVLDPSWSGRVKVRMCDAAKNDEKAIKSYFAKDLLMVLPRLVVNDFSPGDKVKVVKHGSSKYGAICVVIEPNWNGRVKVRMEGKVKSYKCENIERLVD